MYAYWHTSTDIFVYVYIYIYIYIYIYVYTSIVFNLLQPLSATVVPCWINVKTPFS